MTNKSHCGYVAIVGRPNVGKSTLLNGLLGQKISITSHKAQTTRHRILGVKTQDNIQTVYVDTPGIHLPLKRQVYRLMNRTARSVISDVDIVVFVIDAARWTEEDELVLKELKSLRCPVILVMNKVDLFKNAEALLPRIADISSKMNFTKTIPLSALKEKQIRLLEETIHEFLPEGPHFFSDTQKTDRDDRFLVSEIIREKLLRFTHEEVPYDTAVVVESMREEEGVFRIEATIWVERPGQKKIIIGPGGEKLKLIGQKARADLEKLLSRHIFLSLWVKVQEGWTDDISRLKGLGIGS